MSNIADRFLVDETISGQNQEEWKSFTNDKNMSYVVDQQNGNYSNQVSWDLSSIVSQNAWLALQEAYVLMPFSSTIALGTAALTAPAKWSPNQVSLKNNFINFIDSMQVFINGEQVVDQTSLSNMPINVMDMLTMSQDDLKIKGAALNISPDTTTSIHYSGPNATVNGDGYTNNQFLQAANNTGLTSQDYSTMNNGLAQRNLNTATWPQATGNAVNGWPPALSTTTNNFTQILQPYFSEANNASLAVEGTWNYVVYLPLARLCDYFAKQPLIKGSQIILVINFNAGVSTFTTDTTVTNAKLKMTSYTASAGSTNPVLINSPYVNPITSTASSGTITITTKIQTSTVARVATTTAQKGFAALPNCRIYVPLYKVNPTYEERILSNRTQVIRYNDWYQQPILNIDNGSSYSSVLTTALPNVKTLVILPFQTGSTGLFNSFTGAQWQSIFDTAPSTTLPGGMLAFVNFSCQVSGTNCFNLNCNYNYDVWANEVQKIALNGGLSKELSSGLVDLTSWSFSPYLIADISRRNENADKCYQSVTVQGSNNTGVNVDLMCFIQYEKSIEIDVLTGNVKRIF